MKFTRLIMGMPITVQIVDSNPLITIEKVFSYFDYIDQKFSPYKENSELTLINKGQIITEDYSADMKEVLKLCEETKKTTRGYFEILKDDGTIDTSGLVKGWAIFKASQIITDSGFTNFYVEAGGDIQTKGLNDSDKKWSIGIRNPFDKGKVVKILELSGEGIATSGTYERGLHIINPKTHKYADEIASITVIGKNVYEADRFATAAFAMGMKGINFIENTEGLEGYLINNNGVATYTSGFLKYAKGNL